MKKYLLLIFLIPFLVKSVAQDFTSNKISIWNRTSEKIIMHDAEENQLLTLKLDYKYNQHLKKKIKTFKIGSQNYLITKEVKGLEHVYTEDWKLIARMTKNGAAIELIESGKLYKKSKSNKWFENNELVYADINQNIVAKSSSSNSRYKYINLAEKEELDVLLMALVLHQLDGQIQRRKLDNQFVLF